VTKDLNYELQLVSTVKCEIVESKTKSVISPLTQF